MSVNIVAGWSVNSSGDVLWTGMVGLYDLNVSRDVDEDDWVAAAFLMPKKVVAVGSGSTPLAAARVAVAKAAAVEGIAVNVDELFSKYEERQTLWTE